MLSSARRKAPKDNCFVKCVQLFIFTAKDDTNSVNHRQYNLCAFLTAEPVFELIDYNSSVRGTEALPMSKWYFSMTRVLYLGAIHGQSLVQLSNESMFFETNQQIAHNLAFHVYLNKFGVFRLMMCYSHRNSSHISVRTDGAINDVVPKFRQHLLKANQQALIIATRVQISDLKSGDRDGGRCGCVHYGGVFDLYEHQIMSDNLYQCLSDIKLAYFGLYVCDDAKLIFMDICRKCNRVDAKEVHHNRTLYQSGGFLIVEGMLCFQFARYFNEFYTAEHLQKCEIMSQNSILGKINPIYFLGKTNTDSSAWGLLSAEAVREEQWSLIIPDNAWFEAIDDYVTGVAKVIARQSVRVAPFSKNVKNDKYFRSAKTVINSENSGTEQTTDIMRKIDWKKLGSSVGETARNKQFNKNPEQFLTHVSQTTTDVTLPQGSIFRVPDRYELNGELANFLTSFRYKLHNAALQWSSLVYFRLNGFWYKRDCDYKCLPLKLVSCSLQSLPHLYKYGPKEVLPGNDYFDFYRYVQTDKTGKQNAYLIASLQWRSHSEYCINA